MSLRQMTLAGILVASNFYGFVCGSDSVAGPAPDINVYDTKEGFVGVYACTAAAAGGIFF